MALVALFGVSLWGIAHSAVVYPFTFTAPADTVSREPLALGRCTSYIGLWCEDGHCVGKNAWGGPRGLADGPAVPRAPGSPDTVWMVFTESRPLMGVVYVCGVDAQGNTARESNAVRFASFVREDTLMAWAYPDSTRYEWANVHDGYATFNHAMGDTIPRILVSQWGITLKYLKRICKLFGHYAESGEMKECP